MSGVPGGRGGSDRWLLSYADLMTLLFALSVTMYAAAAETPAPTSPTPTTSETEIISDRERAATTVARRNELSQRLAGELADAIGARRLELIHDARGLVVSMPDDAAFPIGSALATDEAQRLIARVGDTLREVPHRIRIEGHTDNLPIRTARYTSNWELSTARASAVVAFLITEVGIDARRLSAAGYGEFHPLAPNDTPAKRARNRRVDLVILDAPERADTAGGGGSHAAP